MSESTFPASFVWGTATASYQVEGGHDLEGRGPSIWDTFCRTPGKVAHDHTGDVSCDQFHRYREDVALMRDLGVNSYRFSIAWPRVFPQKSLARNPRGFDYYHRLVDELLANGIQPAVTLYHWDLPQHLEDAGGWPVRDTAMRFADFAEACFRELGDKVHTWITLNEPSCAAFLGYESGEHAPGRQDRQAAYRAVHHLLLGHGLAAQCFRQGGFKGKLGITLALATPRPATRREEDLLAADRAADKHTRMFLGPLTGRDYPERHLAAWPEVRMPVQDRDMELIAAPLDFVGVNYYFEDCVGHSPQAPERFVQVPTGYPRTHMGWDVVPGGLTRHLKAIGKEYRLAHLVVTENGCAYPDALTGDGQRCHDPDRLSYLRGHLGACAEAIRAGVPLEGYYLWSLIDNFEWAYGYTRRFGIVYCDYVDGRRVPKDSFYYFREVIAGHEQL
jgi:beta-glucosidase